MLRMLRSIMASTSNLFRSVGTGSSVSARSCRRRRRRWRLALVRAGGSEIPRTRWHSGLCSATTTLRPRKAHRCDDHLKPPIPQRASWRRAMTAAWGCWPAIYRTCDSTTSKPARPSSPLIASKGHRYAGVIACANFSTAGPSKNPTSSVPPGLITRLNSRNGTWIAPGS